MKKTSVLLTALVVLFLALSCADSATQTAPEKRVAPERNGWIEPHCEGSRSLQPLYGDVESVDLIRYGTKYSFKFNQRGDVVEYVEYESDGSLRDKTLYEYDSQGNLIEYASYNSDGSLGSKYLYKYDSQGNPIEMVEYRSDVMTPIKKTELKITYRK